MTVDRVLAFWFQELKPSDWFKKSEELDLLIRDQFEGTLTRAVRGELSQWRETAKGRLAEIIVIDQFSRNIYRGLPESFLYDPLALVLAQEAVRAGADVELSRDEKGFLYMPYMHSESLKVHEDAVRLFSQPGQEQRLEFELKHKKIIERFGRYPHRNGILGRISTPDENEFLKTPGSSF